MKKQANFHRYIGIFIMLLNCLIANAQHIIIDKTNDITINSDYNIGGTFIGYAIFFGLIRLFDKSKPTNIEKEKLYKLKKMVDDANKKAAEEELKLKKRHAEIKEKAKINIGEPIDLGLSVMWASSNLMSQCPSEKGNKFSWGSIVISNNSSIPCDCALNNKYNWDLCDLLQNDERSVCGNKSYDIATNLLEDKWRLPQVYEFEELLEECEWEWVVLDGVGGYKVKGKNGNSIFFPVTGERENEDLLNSEAGFYWSGIGSKESTSAICLYISKNERKIIYTGVRWHGMAIRPVFEIDTFKTEVILNDIENHNNFTNYYEKYKRICDLTKRPNRNNILEDIAHQKQYTDDGEKLFMVSDGEGVQKSSVNLQVKDGTKIICDRAYDLHVLIEDFKIPNSVFAIGDKAFGPLLFHSLTIPDSIKYITGNPFSIYHRQIVNNSPYFCFVDNNLLSADGKLFIANLENDKSKYIPEKILCIGRRAFYDHKEIEVIRIPSTCRYIADNAFEDCENLKVVIFKDKIDVIEPTVFSRCISLKRIFVPIGQKDNFEAILPEKLKKIVFENDCELINDQQILNLVVIEEHRIYGDNDTISEDYQNNESDIALISKYKKTICITKADKPNLPISICIDNLVYNYKSEEILRDYSYYDGIDNIPNSIRVIGNKVFWHRDLGNITIPKSIELITGNPFIDCTLHLNCESNNYRLNRNLLIDVHNSILIALIQPEFSFDTSVDIPNDIKIIGRDAFQYIFSEKVLTIPNSVVYIGDSAFEHAAVKKIRMSCNILEISKYAFSNSSIDSIFLPNKLISIGKGAFSGCEYLEEIVIPGSIRVIEEECFYGCKSLKKVIIRNGVRVIKKGAFSFCSKLIDVYIPESVEKIEEDAFSGCMMTTTVLNKNTQIEENAFEQKCKLILI